MNSQENITFVEYLLEQLGGEKEAKSKYMRDTFGSGPESLLGEVLDKADEIGIGDWLRSMTLREVAATLGVPVAELGDLI